MGSRFIMRAKTNKQGFTIRYTSHVVVQENNQREKRSRLKIKFTPTAGHILLDPPLLARRPHLPRNAHRVEQASGRNLERCERVKIERAAVLREELGALVRRQGCRF